jgi:uncharacterized protein
MSASPNPSLAPEPAGRPLAGRRAWLITDGKIGMDVQVRGVADALGLDAEMKHVAPIGVHRFLSPWLPPAASNRIGRGGPLSAPWPEFVLATGRLSIPYLRAVRRMAGAQTTTVILQDPKTGAGSADLIWVPTHDRLRAPNVITTPTAPHSFTPARFAKLRAQMPADIAALPGPRVAVILGGSSGDYPYSDACLQRFSRSLQSLAALSVSFLITPSRRTHPALLAAVDQATAANPRILWRDQGPNPYPDFLAQADVLIATADSVNMCSEIAATGRPAYVFYPAGGTPKFARFHAALQASGAVRPLPDRFERLDTWTYAPLDAGTTIAAEIEKRFAASRRIGKG